MKLSVFGVGYVGAVTAACLARDGHQVIAVDPNATKIKLINAKTPPIVEPGLDVLIKDGVESGRLIATTDSAYAIHESDLSFICVGTPSLMNGDLDLSYVMRVCTEIGWQLREKSSFHSVVIRSTMLPGSMKDIVIPALEQASRKKVGTEIGIAIYPEFLRESTALKDYDEPALVVVGKLDDLTLERIRAINNKIEAPEFITSYATAEAIKYTNNAWHAVKIVFANEIGSIAKGLGIDGHEVMRALCMDTKLNISSTYLRPGFAFGGSCLPKDLRALRYSARSIDVNVPLLEATMRSNEVQVNRAMDMIVARGRRRVGILGLSFKSGTDDLRESPLVEVAERLHGKGYDLRIYDPNVQYSSLMGANLQFVQSHLPHLSALMVERPESVIDHAETLVLGNADTVYQPLLDKTRPDQNIVDLYRIDPTKRSDGRYEGICW